LTATRVDYERRISLAPLSFKGLAMKWWITLENHVSLYNSSSVEKATKELIEKEEEKTNKEEESFMTPLQV